MAVVGLVAVWKNNPWVSVASDEDHFVVQIVALAHAAACAILAVIGALSGDIVAALNSSLDASNGALFP